MSIHTTAQRPSMNPGWLVTLPGGHRYSWYASSRYPTEESVWKVLETDLGQRGVLTARGWTVEPGDAMSFLEPPAPARRVSA